MASRLGRAPGPGGHRPREQETGRYEGSFTAQIQARASLWRLGMRQSPNWGFGEKEDKLLKRPKGLKGR